MADELTTDAPEVTPEPTPEPVPEPVPEPAPEAAPESAPDALTAQERADELARLRQELADRDARDADREMAEIERMRAEVASRDAKRKAEDPEVYLHLANGETVRARESELPGAAGTNALHGYWTKDGKVHHVVGVYPVETDAPEE